MKMKKQIQKTWIILAMAVVFFVSLFSAIYYFSNRQTSYNSTIDLENSKYSATKEIDLALEKLKKQRQKAHELSGVNAEEKVVAITFDDLTDYQTMEALLRLLDSYSARATFFVPGIKGAENPLVVKNIVDKGQEIGNYTLSGRRQMELLSEEELVIDFCRSGVILKELTGKTPTILKCNDTKYSKGLLEVAHACGINTVVNPTYIFNHQSFSSYEKTFEYLSKMEKGSIISIKVKGYLGEEEYKTTKKEDTPAIKKKPSIGDINKKNIYLREEEQLLQVVGWILQALDETGYRTEFIKDLPKCNRTPKKPVRSSKAGKSNGLKTDVRATTALSNDIGMDSKPLVEKEMIDVKPSNYHELRRKNGGKLAKIVNNVYTTQPATSYVFRGISQKSTVNNILKILDSIDARATFFVTGKEIMSYPDTVSSIVSKGHFLGNGGYGMNTKNPSSLSYEDISYEIEMGERILKSFLGEKYNSSNKHYMPLYADIGGFVPEAASALGYKDIIMYNRNPILRSYKDLDADTILGRYFKNMLAFHRGDIIYFRLDYLSQPKAIEELVFKTADRFIKKSNYEIVPVDQLMTNPLVYVPDFSGNGDVSNMIRSSYNYDKSTLNKLVFNNYIGNPSINTAESLVGFNCEEIKKIDTTGRIDTNGEKVIFLTFDDWGSDIAISRLLSVLKKHDVKASFFIRVGYDKLAYEKGIQNPNLLRAIALEGHDIGNHTFTHTKVDIITEKEKELLQKDILVAHREMAKYIGDTGALTTLFRPPTLAVSKLGIGTVFDMGYSYIVNSDFSTQDYRAPSLEFLVDRLKNGINISHWESNVTASTSDEYIRKIEPGSIIIMHMSDESKYTPDALDIIIPYYIERGYRFDKLSNYLKGN